MTELILALGLGIFPAVSRAYVPTPDPHYCRPKHSCTYYVAQNFLPWGTLTPKQSDLLREFIAEIPSAPNPQAAFQAWAETNDALAATFLAVTRTMARMTIYLDNGETRLASDLIVKINRIEGDRVKFTFDPGDFERWKQAGGKYTWALENGKTESGRFRFGGRSLAGNLHRGYDEQGYTSTFKVPRMQINYRFADNEADVDLDGYAPWIAGWIPDPIHLTYKNSDPRQWYDKFLRKFGDAGFTVSKMSFQD